MWDVLLPLQEIEGDSLFSLSPRGNVTMNADNRIDFTASSSGNVRYQIYRDEAWTQRILNLIRASN